MNMMLCLLATFRERADRPTATPYDVHSLTLARTQRKAERGPFKLARRLTRKATLGLAGAF